MPVTCLAFLKRLAFLLLASAAAACAEGPRIPGLTPYRIDIQQGNFVSQEMVAQLKPGMSKDQVRFVLGTPLLADIFHGDRWDYVYWRQAPGGRRRKMRLPRASAWPACTCLPAAS